MTLTAQPERVEAAKKESAMSTIRRGLSLSPELRRGLFGTIAIAIVATAGRIIVPVAIQQIIDGGLQDGGADLMFVARMTAIALAAVLVTAGLPGFRKQPSQAFESGPFATFTTCPCFTKPRNKEVSSLLG